MIFSEKIKSFYFVAPFRWYNGSSYILRSNVCNSVNYFSTFYDVIRNEDIINTDSMLQALRSDFLEILKLTFRCFKKIVIFNPLCLLAFHSTLTTDECSMVIALMV